MAVLSCPYTLSDGIAGTLLAVIIGSEVLHVEIHVSGAIRGINAAEFQRAAAWAIEETAIREAARLLRGSNRRQFEESAGGYYGIAGMLAAASTAARLGEAGEGAAAALRARARRLQARSVERARAMLAGGGLDEVEAGMLAANLRASG